MIEMISTAGKQVFLLKSQALGDTQMRGDRGLSEEEEEWGVEKNKNNKENPAKKMRKAAPHPHKGRPGQKGGSAAGSGPNFSGYETPYQQMMGQRRDVDEEQRQWAKKQETQKQAVQGGREAGLGRIAARHEYESDEMSTAREKAERHLGKGMANPAPGPSMNPNRRKLDPAARDQVRQARMQASQSGGQHDEADQTLRRHTGQSADAYKGFRIVVRLSKATTNDLMPISHGEGVNADYAKHKVHPEYAQRQQKLNETTRKPKPAPLQVPSPTSGGGPAPSKQEETEMYNRMGRK